jgi:hypothetical protein
MKGDNDETAQRARGQHTAAAESGTERVEKSVTAAEARKTKRVTRAVSSSGSSRARRQMGRGSQWQPLPHKGENKGLWEPPRFRNPHHLGHRVVAPKGLPPQGSPIGTTTRTTYLGPSWSKAAYKNEHTTNPRPTPPSNTRSRDACIRSIQEPRKFFQTNNFEEVKKSTQRYTFFKQHTIVTQYTPWSGTGWCRTDRRDGTAGLAHNGLTNADAAFQCTNNLYSCDLKRDKKRAKQRRHRYNKAVKAREQRTAERRQREIKNKTVFYVPCRREKLKNRRANRRQEYRRFMRRMASDLSKKRGLAKLQGNTQTTRKKLLTSSGFKNKIRTLRRENKHKFREKWKHHRQTFMGITQKAYIVKNRHKHKHIDEGKEQTNPRTSTKTGRTASMRKLPRFETLHAITANIRGINSAGKRQILAAKWEKEK